MDGDPRDPLAELQRQLAQWQAQGADRMDPLRFGTLAALAARAPRHAGVARRQLETRLADLAAAYARDVQAWSPPAADPVATTTPLAALLAEVSAHAAANPHYPERPELEELRQLWSQLRTRSQLQASLQALPDDAGPLNSAVLVHRALTLMREVSPGYLQQFIAYADTLSSLQRLRDWHPAFASEHAAAATPARKPSRRAPARAAAKPTDKPAPRKRRR